MRTKLSWAIGATTIPSPWECATEKETKLREVITAGDGNEERTATAPGDEVSGVDREGEGHAVPPRMARNRKRKTMKATRPFRYPRRREGVQTNSPRIWAARNAVTECFGRVLKVKHF